MIYLCENLTGLTKNYMSIKWIKYGECCAMEILDNDLLIIEMIWKIKDGYNFTRDMMNQLLNKYNKYEKCNILFIILNRMNKIRCNKISKIFNGYEYRKQMINHDNSFYILKGLNLRKEKIKQIKKFESYKERIKNNIQFTPIFNEKWYYDMINSRSDSEKFNWWHHATFYFWTEEYNLHKSCSVPLEYYQGPHVRGKCSRSVPISDDYF